MSECMCLLKFLEIERPPSSTPPKKKELGGGSPSLLPKQNDQPKVPSIAPSPSVPSIESPGDFAPARRASPRAAEGFASHRLRLGAKRLFASQDIGWDSRPEILEGMYIKVLQLQC